MRIGEFAKRSGLSRDTIRFYERNGLLESVPERGANNNYRDYPEPLLERVAVIAAAQSSGMSLADIAQLFALQGQADYPQAVDEFLAKKIAEVRCNIAQAQVFLALLEQTRDALNSFDYPR